LYQYLTKQTERERERPEAEISALAETEDAKGASPYFISEGERLFSMLKSKNGSEPNTHSNWFCLECCQAQAPLHVLITQIHRLSKKEELYLTKNACI